jgi:hypothetical protein
VKNPILLTELSALLRAETGHPGPGWRKLNEMACSAVIPAAKNGRNWAVERADLPEVNPDPRAFPVADHGLGKAATLHAWRLWKRGQ